MTTTVTANRKPIFEVAGQECPAYHDRRDILTSITDRRGFPTPSDILLNAILFGRNQKWYYLLSFVIMPDHMHLIIIPETKNISECMKSIKGFSAREINKLFRDKNVPTIGENEIATNRRGFPTPPNNRTSSIWQSGFYDYLLDGEDKVLSRIKYIEDNPVRKGIVKHSEDYNWSSARYRDKTDFNMFF